MGASEITALHCTCDRCGATETTNGEPDSPILPKGWRYAGVSSATCPRDLFDDDNPFSNLESGDKIFLCCSKCIREILKGVK